MRLPSFLALLCLVPGCSSEVTLIQSGLGCTSQESIELGCTNIVDPTLCSDALTAKLSRASNATKESNTRFPSYCYYDSSQDRAFFNAANSSVPCNTVHQCACECSSLPSDEEPGILDSPVTLALAIAAASLVPVAFWTNRLDRVKNASPEGKRNSPRWGEGEEKYSHVQIALAAVNVLGFVSQLEVVYTLYNERNDSYSSYLAGLGIISIVLTLFVNMFTCAKLIFDHAKKNQMFRLWTQKYSGPIAAIVLVSSLNSQSIALLVCYAWDLPYFSAKVGDILYAKLRTFGWSNMFTKDFPTAAIVATSLYYGTSTFSEWLSLGSTCISIGYRIVHVGLRAAILEGIQLQEKRAKEATKISERRGSDDGFDRWGNSVKKSEHADVELQRRSGPSAITETSSQQISLKVATQKVNGVTSKFMRSFPTAVSNDGDSSSASKSHSDRSLTRPRDAEEAIVAEKRAKAVQCLFKVLRASTDFDPRFDGLEFGFSDRRQPLAKFLKGAVGFPLLVPVSHLVRVLPSFFDKSGSIVRFAPAWETIRQMIEDHMEGTYGFTLDNNAMISIRKSVEHANRRYFNLWEALLTLDRDSCTALLKLPGKEDSRDDATREAQNFNPATDFNFAFLQNERSRISFLENKISVISESTRARVESLAREVDEVKATLSSQENDSHGSCSDWSDFNHSPRSSQHSGSFKSVAHGTAHAAGAVAHGASKAGAAAAAAVSNAVHGISAGAHSLGQNVSAAGHSAGHSIARPTSSAAEHSGTQKKSSVSSPRTLKGLGRLIVLAGKKDSRDKQKTTGECGVAASVELCCQKLMAALGDGWVHRSEVISECAHHTDKIKCTAMTLTRAQGQPKQPRPKKGRAKLGYLKKNKASKYVTASSKALLHDIQTTMNFSGDSETKVVRAVATVLIVFTDPFELTRGFEYIKRTFDIVSIINRFALPTSLGWRDMSLRACLSVGSEVADCRIIDINLQLRTFARAKLEADQANAEIGKMLEANPMLKDHSAEIITTIGQLCEMVPSASKSTYVSVTKGFLKVYFRGNGSLALAMGEADDFRSKRIDAAMLYGLLKQHVPDMKIYTEQAYFNRCLGFCRSAERKKGDMKSLLLHLVNTAIIDNLAESLFDEDGTIIGGACFLEEAGAEPRVTSRPMPRSWASALPSTLLTLGPLTTTAAMRDLAQAKSCDDLQERVRHWAPTMGEICWERMAWTKPRERGVVFCLQGIDSPHVRHIWSCADKPPLIDGLFYKEPNVPGYIWTLKKLAEDIECVRDMCEKLTRLKSSSPGCDLSQISLRIAGE